MTALLDRLEKRGFARRTRDTLLRLPDTESTTSKPRRGTASPHQMKETSMTEAKKVDLAAALATFNEPLVAANRRPLQRKQNLPRQGEGQVRLALPPRYRRPPRSPA